MTQAEIARQWGVTDSAICGVVEGLEKGEFIKRVKSTASDADKREKIITITLKGQQIFDRALVEYPQWLSKTIGDLDKSEQEKFISHALQINKLFSRKD